MSNTEIIKTEPTTFFTREAVAWYMEHRHFYGVMYTGEVRKEYIRYVIRNSAICKLHIMAFRRAERFNFLNN